MTAPAAGWRSVALAVVVGAVGAALFLVLRVPLAALLGAMAATMLAALAGAGPRIPDRLRQVMLAVLGVLLGSAFSPSFADQAGAWAVSLLCLPIYIATAAAAGMLFLRRVGRLDVPTAYFAAMPGGISEMVLMSLREGADDRLVALIHVLRVVLVVAGVAGIYALTATGTGQTQSLLPGAPLAEADPIELAILLACTLGWPIAARLNLSNAALLGPLIVSGALHLAGIAETAPPREVVLLAQGVIGASIGCRFAGASLALFGLALRLAVGLTVILSSLTLVFAYALTLVTPAPFAALALAFAPGGLAEMSLVALALGEDAAFVSTHQVARIAIILLVGTQIWRLVRGRPSGDDHEDTGRSTK